MPSPDHLPELGALVRTASGLLSLSECEGFLVAPRHLAARRSDVVGVYRGLVPGAGGDLWWIEHLDGSTGAYLHSEVSESKPPLPKARTLAQSSEIPTATEPSLTLQSTAYLLLRLSLDGTPMPKVCGAGIYSEAHPTTAYGRELYVELLHYTASSFAEAEATILRCIEETPPYRWLRFWLDESPEACNARYFFLRSR